ncbi:MAG: hypothetical protein WA432_00605 [Candidatus Babeliaceae bacterium]
MASVFQAKYFMRGIICMYGLSSSLFAMHSQSLDNCPQLILEKIVYHLALNDLNHPHDINRAIKNIKSLTCTNQNLLSRITHKDFTHSVLHSLALNYDMHVLEAVQMLNTKAARQWFENYEQKLSNYHEREKPLQYVAAWAALITAKLDAQPIIKTDNLFYYKILPLKNDHDRNLYVILNKRAIDCLVPDKMWDIENSNSDPRSVTLRISRSGMDRRCNLKTLKNTYQAIIDTLTSDWILDGFILENPDTNPTERTSHHTLSKNQDLMKHFYPENSKLMGALIDKFKLQQWVTQPLFTYHFPTKIIIYFDIYNDAPYDKVIETLNLTVKAKKDLLMI